MNDDAEPQNEKSKTSPKRNRIKTEFLVFYYIVFIDLLIILFTKYIYNLVLGWFFYLLISLLSVGFIPILYCVISIIFSKNTSSMIVNNINAQEDENPRLINQEKIIQDERPRSVYRDVHDLANDFTTSDMILGCSLESHKGDGGLEDILNTLQFLGFEFLINTGDLEDFIRMEEEDNLKWLSDEGKTFNFLKDLRKNVGEI